jgi:hypothetical protein
VKRGAEDRAREAMLGMDPPAWVYKPPDDARNWKPADFICWLSWADEPDTGTCFVEVKDSPALNVWNISDLRPSQVLAAKKADEFHVPYWVVIWWRRRKMWTISDARALLRSPARRFTYDELSSVYGIDATQEQLGSVLRLCFRGEVMDGGR